VLQDKLSLQSIQFAKAVRWADWKANGASRGRRNAKTVHDLRVATLQSIQENLYKESPGDWDSGPEEETTTTGAAGSGNEEGEVRPKNRSVCSGPGDRVSASVAFLGRCGRRLRTKVAAWTPCACRSTLLVLCKDIVQVNTTLSFRVEDPVSVAGVVDTGAGLSVVSVDRLPPGWRANTWRAPTRTRIVDSSGQARKALARIHFTLRVHDKPMQFPFIVVKRLSVPLIIRCDFQLQNTKTILPQDGKIELSTGAVSDILGYHVGVRGRQYKAQSKPRVLPNELTLAGATVLPPGAQTEVQVMTRSTGSCLIMGTHGLHLAHRHLKKVRRHESSSVQLVTLCRITKRFAKGTRLGVAEPYTGGARPITEKALLAVQQVLASVREVDTEAMQADADPPPEPPVIPRGPSGRPT